MNKSTQLPECYPKKEVARRFETGAGSEIHTDYLTCDIPTAEGLRRVYTFRLIHAYSRRLYVRVVEPEDFVTTIREQVRAFEDLGGAATYHYDNMKVLVKGDPASGS